MTNLSTAAATLATAGWRIFPLVPGQKTPALKDWPHLAADDAARIAAWWNEMPAANVGIATGDHGVFVLDVDCKDGAPGFASLAALEAEHGALPDTLTATTASGGRHLYFASAESIRNSAGKLGAGLDIRGSGGYVVAPPSVTPAGAYSWARLAPIAPAPAWLVELALRAAPVAADTPRATPASIDATPELLSDLRSALAVIAADGRDTWVRMGAALRPLGDDGEALWLEWSAHSDKHDAKRDPQAWHTFGHDSTGYAAVFAEAQRHGWENPARTRHAAEVFGQQPLPAGPALRPVELRDVMTASVTPPRFVVEPLIPAGHVTLFGSHGGAGKSILALSVAAHVATGTPWAGLAVRQSRVLFISLEDAGDVVRHRLRRVIAQHGLSADVVAANLRVLDGAGTQAALMTERATFGTRRLEATPVLHELRATVGGAGLLVIDNASDAYDGDENNRRQVRTFIAELAALGREHDAGVLLLAHIDKAAARFGSQGNSYSGSSAWHNSARSRLALATTSRGGIELVQEKLNLGKASPAIALCWSESGVLIPNPVEPDASGDADARAVQAAIAAAIAQGASVPTARVGSATTQGVLERYSELPDYLRGAAGRRQFWNAISVLLREGKIVAEKYTTASRHERERFCCTGAPRMGADGDASEPHTLH